VRTRGADDEQLPITIREAAPEDWPEIARIYGSGIAGGDATFEESVPSWEAWDATHLRAPRLIAERGGSIIGWAALSAVSARPAYRGVAEVSVYVAPEAAGRGAGTLLLAALMEAAGADGIWTLQAAIFPENSASIRLHQKCGFRTVGVRERLGFHRGRWRDVLLLERRGTASSPPPESETATVPPR
jgi:L-amino acid N-acyltransferase YncA